MYPLLGLPLLPLSAACGQSLTWNSLQPLLPRTRHCSDLAALGLPVKAARRSLSIMGPSNTLETYTTAKYSKTCHERPPSWLTTLRWNSTFSKQMILAKDSNIDFMKNTLKNNTMFSNLRSSNTCLRRIILLAILFVKIQYCECKFLLQGL